MAVATNVSDETASSERAYRRGVFAWSLYDWADHAFITSTAATFFPPYFVAIAAPAFLEASRAAGDTVAQAHARDTASNIFAFAVSIALFIAAILAPIIGTYADITGQRKRQLIIWTIIAGIVSSTMFVITTG